MSKNKAQIEANKRWVAKNKERALYISDRSRSRSFILKKATLKDLTELEQLIAERKKSPVRLRIGYYNLLR